SELAPLATHLAGKGDHLFADARLRALDRGPEGKLRGLGDVHDAVEQELEQRRDRRQAAVRGDERHVLALGEQEDLLIAEAQAPGLDLGFAEVPRQEPVHVLEVKADLWPGE